MKKPQTQPRKPPPRSVSKAIAVPPKNPGRHEVKRTPDPFRGQRTFSL